jgi:hypothetical protein
MIAEHTRPHNPFWLSSYFWAAQIILLEDVRPGLGCDHFFDLVKPQEGGNMKKLMLLAALLAMLVVAAIPAIAQVDQDSEQDADSGDVNQTFDVSNSGSNGNQCVGITGNANTGNAQNQIDLIQYGSDADDFEFDETGANLNVTGDSTTTCDQQVNQAAAAG